MKTGKTILIALALACCALLAQAAPTINARVSTTELSVDDTITLSIEVTGVNNIQGPQQLNIPDFQVQSAGRTQSFQWINGETSSMVTFNFVLTPLKTGTLVIPSVQMPFDNQVLQTHPINVVVKPSGTKVPPSAPAQSHVEESNTEPAAVPTEGLKPVFMAANVDKSKVYVGEQILLTVQFLRRPNVALTAQPRYSEPDLTGFVVEPIKQQEYTTHLNGIPYTVTDLRYALFPTSDGDLAIGNASIVARLQTPMDPFDPNNFFQNFFNQGQQVKLTTHAIPIQVRALPKNKPDNFSGAVGRFKITARVDNSQSEVGKPINLIVKIEGSGNIKALREPQWPEMKSFRRYETITDSKINNEGKFIYGSKEFKVLLIPQVSGTISIPGINFVYFNPDNHQYVTDSTTPLILQVKPGVGVTNPNITEPETESKTPTEGIRVVEKDIRFIKKGTIRPVQTPIVENASYWLLNLIPMLFFMGAAVSVFRSQRRAEKADYYRSKEALHQAKKFLRQAKKRLKLTEGQPFYAALYDGLTEFLAGKLSLSATGLIWTDIESRLKDKGVDDNLRTMVREIWDEADMSRFGIASFSPDEKNSSFKKTELILSQLNKIL